MKLAGPTYRLLWDVHAWTGALASVLLVGMLLLGVVSLFHDELAPWEEPRLRAPTGTSEPQALATLQRVLDERALTAPPARLDVDLPSETAPWIRLAWKEGGADRAQWLHPGTGEIAEARSDLGHFLFLMHFLYPLPGGMLITGLLATLLLLVVTSGLLLQTGRFWRELVRFRPQESLRAMWGDLHKVLGSIGLPFQAVIAWTAAIICLNAMVLQPVVVHTAFDGSLDAGLASIGYPRGPAAEGHAGRAPDVAAVLGAAREALPGADHYRLSIRSLGDASTYVDVRGIERTGLAAFTTVKVTGDGRTFNVREAGGPGITAQLLEGAYVLHSGTFSGWGLRLVYALLGLFTVLCVVTGNLVWLERRSRSRSTFDVLLARLTAGGCGGAAVALAAILVANQLLPETLADRIAWEHGAFYAGWCLSIVGALLAPRPASTAQLMLAGSGGALLLLPWLDAWKHLRTPFDPSGSPYLFGTEVALVLFGVFFLASAWVVRRFIGRPLPGDELQPVGVTAR